METRGEESPGTLRDTAELFKGPVGVRSIALTGLFILACFYTLYFASDFFLPIVLAILLNLLLRPIVRALKRVRVPEAVGAAIVIIGTGGVLVAGAYQLSGPLSEWLGKAPQIAQKLQLKIREIRNPVERVSKATEAVEKVADMGSSPAGVQQVQIKQPGLVETLFSQTFNVAFAAIVMLVLLYFLLASGDLFLRKLIRVLPTLTDKKAAVEIAREIEDNISSYLATISLINACLGTAAGIAFWLLDMPNPALWGVMAGLFNFIPYLGSMVTLSVVTMVAAATFEGLEQILLVPAVYFAIDATEGNLVTPWIVGRRLTLNPVVIFTGVIFWGWLWGIPGALLAVPILSTFKIFCDYIKPLEPIGEFLGT